MCRVILIPGYASSNGAQTVDLLIPGLTAAGHEIVDISYRGAQSNAFLGLWRTRSIDNEKTGHEIAAQIMSGGKPVVLVAHSNGCAIASYVVEKIKSWGFINLIKRVVVISAALTRGYAWSVPVIHFYGEDKVLTIGAVWRSRYSRSKCWMKTKLGGYCTGSRWGSAGAYPDTTSLDAMNIKKPAGHSYLFKLTWWVDEIARWTDAPMDDMTRIG